MKKWIVLVVVVLLALVAAVQLAYRKKAAPVPGRAPAGQEEPHGVALPAEASKPVEQQLPGGRVTASGTYGALPSVAGPLAQRELCKDVNLNRIMADHGSVWGMATKYAAFTSQEDKQVYDALSLYFSCTALAHRDVGDCDYLPGEGAGLKYYASPNYACRFGYTEVAFQAYMAGLEKDESACDLFLMSDVVKGLALPRAEFCQLAAKGMPGVCRGIGGMVPADAAADCRTEFPASASDCGGQQQCLEYYKIYNALKAGRAADCPPGLKPLCEAYTRKDTMACLPLLDKVGKAYCGALTGLIKKSGGYPGKSPEEVKTLLAAEAEKKKEEERILKENKQQETEVNKRVKELIKDGR